VPSRSIDVERNTRPAAPRRRARGKVAPVLQFGAALFAALLAINAVVGENGLIAVLQGRQASAALRGKLAQEKAANERLEEQIQRLKNDPAAIEEVARRELGLIRRGEKVFIIKDLPSPAKP
jgi:cell division protein FtsB